MRTTKARSELPREKVQLPKNQVTKLKKMCTKLKSAFPDKKATFLFSGPSGTEKTMCAEFLSAELGQDLYKVDISMVVSKYIGETEKNLTKLFTMAETSDFVLLFDEADSLFGKRSKAKDPHNKYTNTEMAHLLQRIEKYNGIVILATNSDQSKDLSSLRQIDHVLKFPLHKRKIN